jgi:hypothetical protein
MKRPLARLLQYAIVLVGVVALAFLLAEPLFEGRNAHATLNQVYLGDPFLAFAYVGSIPFFVALVQAFRVLGFAAAQGVFPPTLATSLRNIRYCALAIIGFVAVGEAVIMSNASDDRAGGVFMGLLITVASLAVAAASLFLERRTAR